MARQEVGVVVNGQIEAAEKGWRRGVEPCSDFFARGEGRGTATRWAAHASAQLTHGKPVGLHLCGARRQRVEGVVCGGSSHLRLLRGVDDELRPSRPHLTVGADFQHQLRRSRRTRTRLARRTLRCLRLEWRRAAKLARRDGCTTAARDWWIEHGMRE